MFFSSSCTWESRSPHISLFQEPVEPYVAPWPDWPLPFASAAAPKSGFERLRGGFQSYLRSQPLSGASTTCRRGRATVPELSLFDVAFSRLSREKRVRAQ